MLPGMDDNRRMAELRNGLVCHAGVRAAEADADSEDVEQTLSDLHEPSYLETLPEVRSEEPVVMPELTAPGLPPDIPVSAGLVAAAREGVRTAITAADRLADGARFSYALCRPPGHHAGPDWFAGYCYLNTAAAAALTLREGGVSPVGILDLDLHYPNGTAAIVATMEDASLHSLHAWPVTNVAAGDGRAEQRARARGRVPGSPDAGAPTSTRSAARSRRSPRASRARSSSRSATTPSRATRTAAGPSRRDLHPDRPPARRLAAGPSASSRRAATPSTPWPPAATPSPPACSEVRRRLPVRLFPHMPA